MNAYNILSQNAFWRTNKAITHYLDDLVASSLLSFLVDKEHYHTTQGTLVESEGESWFYATSDAIKDELRLSYHKQKAAIQLLQKHGLIETKLIGLPAKLHFNIDHNKVCDIANPSIRKNAKLEDGFFENNIRTKNKNKYKPLTPKGEHLAASPEIQEEKVEVESGEVKKETKAEQVNRRAKESLEFFNSYTGRSLSGDAHLDAFKSLLRKNVTPQDLACAIYEQEYNLRGHDNRNKWLTPLTLCRKANFQRALDSWKDRKPEEQEKARLTSPGAAQKLPNGEQVSTIETNPGETAIPPATWKDWPLVKGWSKSTIPGYYQDSIHGAVHFSQMVANRQARFATFPAAIIKISQTNA